MFENDKDEFEQYSYRIKPEEPIRDYVGEERTEDRTEERQDYTQTGSVYEEAKNRYRRHSRRMRSSRPVRSGRRMNAYLKALCCAIIFGVVAGGIILGSAAVSKKMIAKSSSVPTTTAKLNTTQPEGNADSSTSGEGYSVSQIAAQCKSSVVAITNKSISEIQTFFGVMQQENEGSGSGVIIGKNDTELLIATNNHVVENSETLTVCFNDSEDAVFNAQIKGTDPENDLAVVAIKLSDIDADVLNSISIATIGDSSSLEVGDQVVAIGNALGIGQSVTQGIVSATNREVTIEDTTATLIQTDAAINPGNSGGALFNMKGELVGINSAKFASEQIEGMGFAIPMSTAQPIVENLMARQTREKVDSGYGYLNISGRNVSEDVSEMYGIPQGAYVAEVNEGGAAQKAGLQQGDIITKFDGKSITGIDQLIEELKYYKAGETVEMVIQRNSDSGYKEQTVSVTLDKAPDRQENQNSQNSQGNSGAQNGQGNQNGQSVPFFFGNENWFQ